MPPRICVLRAPGTNCDVETAHAFELAGGIAERVHLFRLLESPELLRSFEVLCIPGGFSYGDDLGAGVVFGSQLRGRLAEAIREFLTRDTLTLGICNGFQVLIKAGILPDGAANWPPAVETPRRVTLTWNRNGRYTATWVKLRICSPHNVFLRGLDEIELPVAHAEGRIGVAAPDLVDRWHAAGQIALAYAGESSAAPYSPHEPILPPAYNPNGSISNIAGLGDSSGRVLGLMPHPERHLFATQHPRWTRDRRRGIGVGRRLFQNAVDYFASR